MKSLNHQSIDLIHCRSYITSIVALKIKIKYNIPFIFDMRGFYADERVDGKIWNKSNFIFKNVYNYFKRKEKEFSKYKIMENVERGACRMRQTQATVDF